MKTKTISFKTKIILLVEIIFIVINSLSGFIIWKQLSFMVREISRSKLKSIAATTAIMLNVEDHEAIQSEEDVDSESYHKVKAILQKSMEANPEAFDIYTARKLKDGSWEYILGGYETYDENGNGIIESQEEEITFGENFDASGFPEIETALLEPSADKDINCDKWGCWLSGYAPVKDATNKTVAITGVDISADNIVAFEKNIKYLIAGIISTLLIIFPLILLYFLNILLKPVSTIVEGMHKFRTDLTSRIQIDSQDELGLISNTFNTMAEHLEELYANLEDKVKEKTRALADKIKEIRKNKAEDEALLESIGEGIVAVNKNGKIMFLNQQAGSMLGINIRESVDKSLNSFIKIEDFIEKSIPITKWPITQSLTDGKKVSGKYHIVTKNNKLPVMVTSTPVSLGNNLIGAIVIFRDFSQEKEIDRTKSEFVSLASHQLRTPLTNISWQTDLLSSSESGKLNNRQRKLLSKITQANQKMIDLVNSLLNVSRIEMGSFIIENKLLQLDKIAKSVINELKPLIDKKEIEITLEVETNNPLSADSNLIRIIFQNLLSNAVKYTPSKGKIRITISKEDNWVTINISDTGYGIPVKEQGKIFEKMFRAENIKEIDPDGTGLGLYIVKSILENSGGMIYFESEENKGTTFTVKIPSTGMKAKKGSKKLN